MLIDITEADVVREPKWKPHVTLLDGHGTIRFESRWDKEYGIPSPCPMLKDNQCYIYRTRPDVCKEFEIGGTQCKDCHAWDRGETVMLT